MDRRNFSAAFGTGACLYALRLQAQPRQAHLAWVTLARADPNSAFLETFRTRLRELGWVEGRNLTIEPWGADGSGTRLKELVPQIGASRADLIIATGGPTVRYFTDVPVAQPVAFSSSADPVIGGLVKSMAQPGVNRTGVTFFSLDLAPKRLAMMKELLPGMKQVAIVGWPPHAGETLELKVAAEAAAKLGLAHSYHGVVTAEELDAALQAIERSRADAVLVFAGTIASQFPDRFAAFSLRTRRPTVRDELRADPARELRHAGRDRRPVAARREGGRDAGSGPDPDRDGAESQDGERDRPALATGRDAARRPADRVTRRAAAGGARGPGQAVATASRRENRQPSSV